MPNDKSRKEMTFLQHVEELRWHILRSLFAMMIMAIVVFLFKDFVFGEIILKPTKPEFITYRVLCSLSHALSLGEKLCIGQVSLPLQNTEMVGQFMAHVRIALGLGLIMAIPYVLWEVWKFVKPALHINELRYARGFVLVCTSLFLAGVLFSYYIVVPFSVTFLGTYAVDQNVVNVVRLSSYIQFVTTLCFAGGIIFQMPVAVWILSRIGLLTPSFMKKYRKHAILIILIVSAVVTPPDVFSMILMSIPLLGLYEVSIVISARVHKKRQAQELAEAG
jgi:sec-independent protein translocase protein TatC